MQRLQFFVPNFDRTLAFNALFGDELKQEDNQPRQVNPWGILADPDSPEFLERYKADKAIKLKGLSLMSGYLTEEDFKKYYGLIFPETPSHESQVSVLLKEVKIISSRNAANNDFCGYSKEYHEMMVESGMVCVDEPTFADLLINYIDPQFSHFEIRYEQFKKHANLLGLDADDLLSHTFYPNGTLFVITPDIIRVIGSIAQFQLDSITNINDDSGWEKFIGILSDIKKLISLSNRNLLMGTFF